jgi:hypothetical protein
MDFKTLFFTELHCLLRVMFQDSSCLGCQSEVSLFRIDCGLPLGLL